jgi:hypothetical protein
MVISEQAGRALYHAACQRGPNKGLLLRRPPRDKLARAAWYGAQSVCNPFKLSIPALLMMQEDERAIYREIESFFDKMKASGWRPEFLDRDRLALEKLGAW